ncbi:hypothetical protein BJ742DRAFT_853240 [Cladochytrium replicatum]|nr:hypothetical protein BJ742DRAFT_853240 [Cladochytrium replicatum]
MDYWSTLIASSSQNLNTSSMPYYNTMVVAAGIVVVAASYSIWRFSGFSADAVPKYGEQLRRKSVSGGNKKEKKNAASRSLTRLKEPFYPGGLYNMGNTCFMNSVVQALASLPSLFMYLRDRSLIYYSVLVPNPNDCEGKIPLVVTEALLDLIVALNKSNSSRRSVLRPSALLNAVSVANGRDARRLLCYEQQDAQEFMQLVSQNLTKEEEPSPPIVTSLFDFDLVKQSIQNEAHLRIASTDTSGSSIGGGMEKYLPKIMAEFAPRSNSVMRLRKDFEAQRRSKANKHGETSTANGVRGDAGRTVMHLGRPMRLGSLASLKNPLTGLVAQKVTCSRCKYTTPVRHFTFDNISLTVPNSPYQASSIEAVLRAYVSPEVLQDWTCESCSMLATQKKQERDIERKKAQMDGLRDELKEMKESLKKRQAKVAANHVDEQQDEWSSNVAEEKVEKAKSKPTKNSQPSIKSLQQKAKKLEDSIRKELELFVQMSKDLEFLKNAARFDPEAKLPPTVKLVKVASPSTKQVMIAKPPQCLCLHMNRSVFHASHAYKNSTQVMFSDFLDIAPFCVESSSFVSTINGEKGKKGMMRPKMANGLPYGIVRIPRKRNEVEVVHTDRDGPVLEEVGSPNGRETYSSDDSTLEERGYSTGSTNVNSLPHGDDSSIASSVTTFQTAPPPDNHIEQDLENNSVPLTGDSHVPESDGGEKGDGYMDACVPNMDGKLSSALQESKSAPTPEASAQLPAKLNGSVGPKAAPAKKSPDVTTSESNSSKALDPIEYPYLYRLHAVVVHYGMHDSGHFVTYRRAPERIRREMEADESTVASIIDYLSMENGRTTLESSSGGWGYSSSSDQDTNVIANTNDNTSSEGLRRRRGDGAQRRSKTVKGNEEFWDDDNDVDTRDRWFRISDDRVDLVHDAREVYSHGSEHCYMLFYERVRMVALAI